MNYTVFGEAESGLEVIDKIAAAARDTNNRPYNDIKMKMKIVRKK
jgi:peptidyl-prolyl cis-trans isomerase B (cyclophilin B)